MRFIHQQEPQALYFYGGYSFGVTFGSNIPGRGVLIFPTFACLKRPYMTFDDRTNLISIIHIGPHSVMGDNRNELVGLYQCGIMALIHFLGVLYCTLLPLLLSLQFLTIILCLKLPQHKQKHAYHKRYTTTDASLNDAFQSSGGPNPPLANNWCIAYSTIAIVMNNTKETYCFVQKRKVYRYSDSTLTQPPF